MDTLKILIWRNLREHPLRTFLSGLAIAFGVAMIIAADMVGASLLDALLNANVEGAEITHGFMAEQFDLIISVIGYALIAAAGFLVFNAFTMTVTQRRQQIGLLRSLGMNRRQTMRVVLLEGLLLGVLGIGAGLISGPLMGQGVIAFLKLVGGDYLAFSGDAAISISAVFQATLMGMGMTVLSIFWPAYRASGLTPIDALRHSSTIGAPTGRRSTGGQTVGLLLVLASVAFIVIAPPGSWANAPWNTRWTVILLGSWLTGWLLLLPAVIRLTGRIARQILARRGASGRLAADNLRRDTGRVSLTIITLAFGLIMIIGMTGFMTFAFDELFGPSLDRIVARQGWAIFPFDLGGGVFSVTGVDSLLIAPETVEEVKAAVGEQANIVEFFFVPVPELSFLGDAYFSYVLDPAVVHEEPAYFEFSQGDWESAGPIMEAGCGLLIAPAVAQQNGVKLFDNLTITTPQGPLDCTVAGLGRPFMNASIISSAAAPAFNLVAPIGLAITPRDGIDHTAFNANMQTLDNHLPDMWMTSLVDYSMLVDEVFDLFTATLNGMLLLVVIAAAFGVVNTMVMSVAERRAELGILRAVGSTRRQTESVIVGEAALMGLIGGLLGLIVGAGTVLIIIMAYGGRSWGLVDLDLWAAAGRTLPPALVNGLVGLIATPLIAGLAAWLPARQAARQMTVDLLAD